MKSDNFTLLGKLFTWLFYVCLEQVEYSDMFKVNSCSCDITCNDGDILPSSEVEEPQKIIPIIWKSLKHNSLDFSESIILYA